MTYDVKLKAKADVVLEDFGQKHSLQGVVEVTSTKASHILLGVYEGRDGKWLARIQPAHLFDGQYKAGTYSLTIDQLDQLIEGLTQMREVLDDKPTNKVQVVQSKRIPTKQAAAAATQAPAPVPAAADPVLEAVDKLSRGLEAISRRLEALEAAVPEGNDEQEENEQAEIEAEWARDIAWQVKHTQPSYDCPVCSKSYKTRGRYLAHLEQEHGIELDL